MGDVRLRQAFQSPWLAALVGAAVAAASLSLTGNLTVGGNSTLGDNATVDTTLVNGVATIRTGASPSTVGAGLAGTVASIEQVDGTADYLTFRGTVAKGLLFNNASAQGDGYILYDQTARSVTLAAQGTIQLTVASSAITTTPVINENGWTTLTQASPQSVTNASDQDSNTFTFAVTQNNLYDVMCDLFVDGANAANDFEFRFTVTAGTMTGRGMVLHPNAADAATTTLISAAAAANTNQIPVGTFGGTNLPIHVTVTYAFIQATSNATFKLQFGNLVTGVGIASQMETNSRCRWRVIR